MTVRTNRTAHVDSSLPDEARLVHQAKSGNSEAFAQLYDAYVERVYRYILFRVSEDVTTEDLVSQVFLKAWQNLDRYKTGGSPFIAWLYTIARNLVIDYYRAKKRCCPWRMPGHCPLICKARMRKWKCVSTCKPCAMGFNH